MTSDRTGNGKKGGGARKPRFFYGWVVVAAVFVVLTFAAGLGFYNATVYLQALVDEQGFSIGAASGATAMFFVVSGLAAIPIARIVERYDPRWVIVSGALIGGLALLLLGRVQELWQLYVVYMIFGLGFAAASFVPGTTLITRWFSGRRALALSIATTGLSMGGILITPASAGFIARDGLSSVSPWLAGLFVVGIAPVAILFIRPAPASMNLYPDGANEPTAEQKGQVVGTAYREAVRTPFFFLVTLGFALLLLTQVGGLAHLFPLVTGRSGAAVAATAVSTVAFASIAGRFIGTWVLQHLSPMRFTVALAALQSAAILMLALSESPVMLLTGAVLFGVTVGNVLILIPLVLVEEFGMQDYPSIYSLNQFLATLGVAAGPILVGLLHDATAGYTIPLLAATGVSAAAAATLAFANRSGQADQPSKVGS
ncbi:MAG: MFS transporter [Rubrobacteraceae bacterium]